VSFTKVAIMPEEIVNESRDIIVNTHFQAFLAALAQDVGEAPMGACCVVAWQEASRVSVAASLAAQAPPALQMRIADLLAKKFAQAIQALKLRINTRPRPSA